MEQQIDVRAIRAHLGLTQAQLAEAVGVDQSTVSTWENGSAPRGAARKLLEHLFAQAGGHLNPASLAEAS